MNELPEGWALIKTSEIGRLLRGVNYKKEDASNEPREGYLPVLRGNNIQEVLNLNDLVFVHQKNISIEQKVLAGDIVFAMSSGSKHLVGKSAKAKDDFNGSFGAFCGVFRANEKVNKDFAAYFFKGPYYKKTISEISKGTNINNLKREHILDLDFPLPPLLVQHAIVTKIEEIFSELDHGVEQLKTARQQLKVYRQSVLKWAFEGRLTEANIVEGELPAGWKVEQLSRVCKFSQGIQVPIGNQKIDPFPGSVRFLRIIDFTQGDDPPRYIENPGEKYLLKKDEIAMVRYGTVGFVCTGKEGVIANNLFKIVPVESLTKKYLIHFLQSHLFLRKLETKGATMQALSFGLINPIPIPLPPLTEQHQIVSEIERRLSVCDKLEETIEAGLKQAEVLRAGVLKMAFEGRLVGS